MIKLHLTFADWQYETANFLSSPEDVYYSINVERPAEHAVPFCATGCDSKCPLLGDSPNEMAKHFRYCRVYFIQNY